MGGVAGAEDFTAWLPPAGTLGFVIGLSRLSWWYFNDLTRRYADRVREQDVEIATLRHESAVARDELADCREELTNVRVVLSGLIRLVEIHGIEIPAGLRLHDPGREAT